MAQRFTRTLASFLLFDSQNGRHRPMVKPDRRCGRMSSIAAVATIALGNQDDSAHLRHAKADFSHDDVEKDAPPSSRNFDHVSGAVEIAHVDAEEEDTDDRLDFKIERKNASLLSYRRSPQVANVDFQKKGPKDKERK
eukprot:TRINITY_DN12757_c0_g1_i2.p1 TRINITY_DN12757_c0_g1~~TRINITY_DN12757_c0_g1_i2.p1  ORF type:complete len:138 (+),score=26.96 TRINITY_DN12757_c0_g1_i2:57-470(+)